MKSTALVIMAAGIGSRFGGGIKQLEPVGPNGEIIMDYSIHDALEAGFNKVVFIIRKDLEKDFKEIIGNRIEKLTKVEYVFQEIHALPDGFTAPEDRKKPWGTGQAVLCCKDAVQEPFVVINADDYYGKEGFVKVHDYLVAERPENGKIDICMAGFILGNTLSDNGAVTRGVCRVNEKGQLVGVDETGNIVRTENGGAGIAQEDGSVETIDAAGLVSMNMWGLTPEFMQVLEEGFVEFLKAHGTEAKAEYLLPAVVDQLIKEDRTEVAVLKSHDTWFGVTYKEDKPSVVNSFRKLIADGVYKEKLFD